MARYLCPLKYAFLRKNLQIKKYAILLGKCFKCECFCSSSSSTFCTALVLASSSSSSSSSFSSSSAFGGMSAQMAESLHENWNSNGVLAINKTAVRIVLEKPILLIFLIYLPGVGKWKWLQMDVSLGRKRSQEKCQDHVCNIWMATPSSPSNRR